MFEQQLIEYYNRNLADKFPIATIGRTIGKAIVISIDLNGNYLSSSFEKFENLFLNVPCTIESASPSGKNAKDYPHPIFNSIKYIFKNENLKLSEKYIELLDIFNSSKFSLPETKAIERYWNEKYSPDHLTSVCQDFSTEKYKDVYILFKIIDVNSINGGELWRNNTISIKWTEYYMEYLNTHLEKTFDVFGNDYDFPVENIPAISFFGTARLISHNNTKNKFNGCNDLGGIGYSSSQKICIAINSLLRSRQNRILINEKDREHMVFFSDYDSIESPEIDLGNDEDSDLDVKYDESELEESIVKSINTSKYENEGLIKNHDSNVYIFGICSPSDGCCTFTFADILSRNEYLKNVDFWKKNMVMIYKDGNVYGLSTSRIVNLIFDEKDKSSERGIVKKTLINTMIHGRKVPRTIINKLEMAYKRVVKVQDPSKWKPGNTPEKNKNTVLKTKKEDLERVILAINEYNNKIENLLTSN